MQRRQAINGLYPTGQRIPNSVAGLQHLAPRLIISISVPSTWFGATHVPFVAISNLQQHREDVGLSALDAACQMFQHLPQHNQAVLDLTLALESSVSLDQNPIVSPTLVGSKNFINALKNRSKFLSFVHICDLSVGKDADFSIKGEGLDGWREMGLRGGENMSTAGFSMQNRASFCSRGTSAWPCSKANIKVFSSST